MFYKCVLRGKRASLHRQLFYGWLDWCDGKRVRQMSQDEKNSENEKNTHTHTHTWKLDRELVMYFELRKKSVRVLMGIVFGNGFRGIVDLGFVVICENFKNSCLLYLNHEGTNYIVSIYFYFLYLTECLVLLIKWTS